MGAAPWAGARRELLLENPTSCCQQISPFPIHPAQARHVRGTAGFTVPHPPSASSAMWVGAATHPKHALQHAPALTVALPEVSVVTPGAVIDSTEPGWS